MEFKKLIIISLVTLGVWPSLPLSAQQNQSVSFTEQARTRIILKRPYSNLFNDETIKVYLNDFYTNNLEVDKEKTLEVPTGNRNVIFLETIYGKDSIVVPQMPYHTYYYTVRFSRIDNTSRLSVILEKEIAPTNADKPEESFYLQKGITPSFRSRASLFGGLCLSTSLITSGPPSDTIPATPLNQPFNNRFVGFEFGYMATQKVGIDLPFMVSFGNRAYTLNDTLPSTEKSLLLIFGPGVHYKYLSPNKVFFLNLMGGFAVVSNVSSVKNASSFVMEETSFAAQLDIKATVALGPGAGLFFDNRFIHDINPNQKSTKYSFFMSSMGLSWHF